MTHLSTWLQSQNCLQALQKKILIATDGSESAGLIADAGINSLALAGQNQGNLCGSLWIYRTRPEVGF